MMSCYKIHNTASFSREQRIRGYYESRRTFLLHLHKRARKLITISRRKETEVNAQRPPRRLISLRKTSPTGWFGLRRTAALTIFGTLSLSSSTHFPLNPSPTANATAVMLPAGRARLPMMPWPSGSVTAANTTGILIPAFFSR